MGNGQWDIINEQWSMSNNQSAMNAQKNGSGASLRVKQGNPGIDRHAFGNYTLDIGLYRFSINY